MTFFDTRVGQEMNVGVLGERQCPPNNCCGGLSHDLLGNLPGKDLPRDVVHDGVEIDLGAVEEEDDWSSSRCVDAPRSWLVRSTPM
ncbi:MAG: hypothetical protein K0V04_23985 [Deltaproteobacteria bacterium]|nr:hypothetical protein [Deltaproteobacteria bacterium]